MTMILPDIITANRGHLTAVADLIAEAFTPLAASVWLVPEAHRRRSVLLDTMRIHVEHALTHGHVDLLSDRTGAAVWLHCHQPVLPPVNYEQRLSAACGPDTDRFATLDTLMAEHHPAEAHHHLAMLAVAPAWQRTARGSLLLRHHHARLTRTGLPAYLEASSPNSRNLYTRHGYHTRDRFTLPDGTAFWPMWRTSIPAAAPPPERHPSALNGRRGIAEPS